MVHNSMRITLKKQISRLNIWILLIVVASILFYNMMNLFTMNSYDKAFNQYDQINSYHTSLQQANDSIKEYLYTENPSSYKEYKKNIKSARHNLQNIIEVPNIQDTWRIQTLINMLDSYEEKVGQTKYSFDTNDGLYDALYSDLLDSYELIKSTSAYYYEVLTDEMKLQNTRFHQTKILIWSLSFIFAMSVIIWLYYYTKKTTNAIANPLYEILNNMKKIQNGEYKLSEISNANEEIHELYLAMEQMASSIQNDIRTTKENALLEQKLLVIENESLKKDELLAQSEVKMLQNQINPHFLFNTLNMTYKLALQEEAPRCSEMIERTCALLRYGLDKQNSLSTLQEEIRAIENYIMIQERRLGDRIHFELQVEEHLPAISIPGMIIQPIIENSLKHGLKDSLEDGEIIVSCYSHEHTVYIQVSDNGEGMDSSELEDMVLRDFQDDEHKHLGMYNVAKRLYTFFGQRVDVSVHSSKGCGFQFVIKIEVNENGA